MSETVFVTGATGLAGANICKLLIERGDTVRALARAEADTDPLAALGVEVITGDVTDSGDVRRAATGAGSAAAESCGVRPSSRARRAVSATAAIALVWS